MVTPDLVDISGFRGQKGRRAPAVPIRHTVRREALAVSSNSCMDRKDAARVLTTRLVKRLYFLQHDGSEMVGMSLGLPLPAIN